MAESATSVSDGSSRQAGGYRDDGKLQALLQLNDAVQARRPSTSPPDLSTFLSSFVFF